MSVHELHPIPGFPADRRTQFDPAPEYTALVRAGRPVSRVRLWNGEAVWLLTGYEEVRLALSDPRFSADMSWPRFPVISPQRFDLLLKGTFLRLDGAAHARVRRRLTGEFTVRRMAALRPRVQQVVDECLNRIAALGGPLDLFRQFALPVPSLVICELLGTPYADHDFFQQRSRAMIDFRSTPQETIDATRELQTYLAELVEAKAAAPGDDLISRLLAEREQDGGLGRAELISVAWLLLLAGHETTANMIGLGMLALLQDPRQCALLRGEPELIPGAVEELLRYLSILQRGLGRVATAPIELGGEHIAAGDGVIALVPSANRDPSRYQDPDTLDVTRQARGHVAFGYGAHQCIGQALARMELVIAFTEWLRRFPTMRLAVPPEQVGLRHESLVYGVEELPVTW